LGTVIFVGLINLWAFIPAAIAGICRHQFAPGSRDLKRLLGTTKSPVYSHFTSTIHGLKVIRSYRAERMCCDEFLRHLEDNTRVSFLINILNRWVALRFDWISILFVALVTILAVVARITQQQFSAADIALTLSFSINLVGLLQWTIRFVYNIFIHVLTDVFESILFFQDNQFKLNQK
jgi:ATP-binding cassette subfamily C (CFTR/MRP) protein 4